MPDMIFDFSESQYPDWLRENDNNSETPVKRIFSIINNEKYKSIMIRYDWDKPFTLFNGIKDYIKRIPLRLQVYIQDASSVHRSNLGFFNDLKCDLIIDQCNIDNSLSGIKNLINNCNDFYIYINDLDSDYSEFPAELLKHNRSFPGFIISLEHTDFFSKPCLNKYDGSDLFFNKLIKAIDRLSDTNKLFKFHCGFSLCYFNRGQLGNLAKYRILFPVSYCYPVCVVSANGDVNYCYSLTSQEKINIFQTGSLTSVKKTLLESVSSYSTFCNNDNASNCRSRLTNGCGGGCLASTIHEWGR